MKTISTILFATFLLIGTANAAPIQWADNGHWYDVVWIEAGLSWEDAAGMADASGGHLVTLTSEAENLFVWDHVLLPNLGDTLYKSYWLGGYQNDFSAEPDGGWAWVTGEDWIYENWHPGEPNNGANQDQHYLHFWDTDNGQWDDMQNGSHVGGYVIEYSDMPTATPEPGTMFLLGSGLLGLAGLRRKLSK
jgi:hypothetical protein